MGCGGSVTVEIKVKKGQAVQMPGDKSKLPTVLFCTYRMKKSSYEDSHNLYVIDRHTLSVIPPPHVPSTRKKEIFKLERYHKVDKRVTKVPNGVKRGMLQNLVEWLIKPCPEDDLTKLRLLYRWITSQDIQKFKPPLTIIEKGSIFYYLIRLQNKEINYAQLMCYMCSYAGLVCVVIHGYLKGSAYKVGQSVSNNKPHLYGEWNAVLINDNWRFINAYWGACATSSDDEGNTVEKATFSYDESFFIPDPENLAYTHYPDDPRWQLLDRTMSMKQFEKKAFLKERFFEMEMRVLTHPECDIKCENGEIDVLFGLPAERSDMYMFKCIVSVEDEIDEWKAIDSNQYRPDFVDLPNDTHAVVKVRFPGKGKYKVEILGKDTACNLPDYDYDWIAIYSVNCVNAGKYIGFPICGEAGWGCGKNGRKLESVNLKPQNYTQGLVFAEGGYLDATFKSTDEEQEDLKIAFKLTYVGCGLDDSEYNTESVLRRKSEYTLFNDVPPDKEYAVCMFVEEEVPLTEEEQEMELQAQKQPNYVPKPKEYVWRNLCNYYIVSSKLPPGSKFADIDNTRKQVVKANKEKRLEPIERAVDLVGQKDYERYMQKEVEYSRRLIDRLRELQLRQHEVVIIDQVDLDKLYLINPPDPEIFMILKATLLFLGHFDDETRKWEDIQRICKRPGKMTLRRRLAEFDINEMELDIALGGKKLIGTMKIDYIRRFSPSSATLMAWILCVANEMALRNPKTASGTVPRITRRKADKLTAKLLAQNMEALEEDVIFAEEDEGIELPDDVDYYSTEEDDVPEGQQVPV